MITTLLLDLDDTLLENKDEIFIPTYFAEMSQHLSEIIPKERLLGQLIAGTTAMLENQNPARHLKEVFDSVFYPGIMISEEDLLPMTDAFYETEFPKLQSLTNKIDGSKEIIEYAFSKGIEVVIATNPLYPRTAVEQRLEWAGVPVDQYAYSLVTSYENSHFAKPHLEYYAEILAKLGRNPHDAVMIGNDKSDDIEPAQALGMTPFYISEENMTSDAGGNLKDAIDWLKGEPDFIDPRSAANHGSLSARLMGNLVAFGDLSSNAKNANWKSKPSSEGWAAIEVVAHLRDVEVEINYPRIKSILEDEVPFLSAVDSDSWAEVRGYIDRDPAEVLDSLWQARMKTISLIANEAPGIWERSARHAIFGPTKLSELVLIFIEHDLLHLRQLRTLFNQN